MDQLTVAARFNGPPRSGNGGYTSGLVAQELGLTTPVEVTLRRPPPLGLPLDLRHEDGVVTVTHDGDPIAEARAVEDDLAAVEPVDVAAATAASARYPGLTFHPFPTCFACGVDRPEGLRVFPGPVDPEDQDESRVAAVWTPGEAEAATTWAALDCIGGWAGDLGMRLMVLGRMTAVLDALPVVGEPHVVVGQPDGSEGRRTFTRSTLYDPDGRIVGRARHVWVAVDPSTFNA